MIKKIQKAIDKFAFPISINRTRFDLKHWKQWKASEFRTFFFYMAVPILKDYLKPKYFWNLCILVFGNIFYLFFCPLIIHKYYFILILY